MKIMFIEFPKHQKFKNKQENLQKIAWCFAMTQGRCEVFFSLCLSACIQKGEKAHSLTVTQR